MKLMKFFTIITAIFIFHILLNSNASAANYYISATGKDSDNGFSPATPWQTINKLNSLFAIFSPGDSILFKRGDTFYGSLVVNQSGTSSKPIVISAYGVGSKPIISGLSTISSWTSLGNNIYEATVPNNKLNINCVVINNEIQPIGRYPKLSAANGGYLNFESHSTDAQITDNQLAASPNWAGGQIVIRKNHWILDKSVITSHVGNVLNFIPAVPSQTGYTVYKLVDQSRYFIQNHPSALTENGDWCYDNSTYKIKIYCSTLPPEVKVSTIDQLVTIASYNYIKVSNISFEGANTRALYANRVLSLSIDSCNFKFSGTYAALISSPTGAVVISKNTVSNSLNNVLTIYASSRGFGDYCTVQDNTITNTAIYPGMGENGDGNYVGLEVVSANGATIERNTILNTGYVPLAFRGNNILVKNNVIDNFCYTKDDGGGIYTCNAGSPLKILSKSTVIGNIISNGSGNGIYMDNNSNFIDIKDNTVFNIPGKNGNHNNSPAFINMTGNTFFNIANCVSLVRWVADGSDVPNGGQDITNMNIQNNIFFTTSATQTGFTYGDRGVNFPNPSTLQTRIQAMGTINNNYYHLPNELGFGYAYRNDKSSGYISSPPLSFTSWQALTGFEQNTTLLTPIANIADCVRFEVNATNAIKTVYLAAEYVTMDGTNYTGNINIQPFSSKVLILKQYFHPIIATGIEGSPLNNVSDDYEIFPNPVNDYITINSSKFTDGKPFNIIITNVVGQNVFNDKIFASNNSLQINCNNLSKGLYLLGIKSENGLIVKKIIKQ